MDLAIFFKSLLLLAFFLMLGSTIKRVLLKDLIVPPALIAGLLALIMGPQLLGHYLNLSIAQQTIGIDDSVISVWRELPGYLIVAVFAGLFLGKKIPTFEQSLNASLPNLAFGYTVAIGQYVVGMLAALLVLSPLFDTKAISGALIAVGFQGGHGTVAGLQSTFESLDFSKGTDLGLGIATIGLVSAIVFGTIMSNRADSTADSKQNKQQEGSESDMDSSHRASSFVLQFAILGTVILLAWLLLTGLQQVEKQLFSDASVAIFKYMPLFPVAMLVGLVVQVVLNKIGAHNIVRHHQIDLLSSLSLNLLIVAALGSLDLAVLAQYWQSILILGFVGVTYSLFIYFFLGSWFFKERWKSRGIGEIGQSMGTTAVGLLMLKHATKGANNSDVRAFSYKQPLYEPVVGGGLVTALAIPAIANMGAWGFLVLMASVLCVIVVGFAIYKRR